MNTKTLKGMGAAVSLLVGIGTASPHLQHRPAGKHWTSRRAPWRFHLQPP